MSYQPNPPASTDLEKVKALFNELGIEYAQEAAPEPQLTLLASSCGRVDGYLGFYANFDFTPEGSFVKVGIWE